jgi:hypothetical protein
MGVVHRITYSFSYSLLTYIFVYLIIIDVKNGVLYPIAQLNHFLVNDTVTALYSLTYTILVCDCCLTGLLASVIHSQPFCRLNVSPYNPSYLSPTVLNIRWQIKPTTYGYEPSVTDASKPKKQIYQKMFGYNIWLFSSHYWSLKAPLW